ncbi:MAG TPA: GNAT family N-acetyltransferase [Bauldia sp.]|nr:GNAT family N-acetyltransferase [Bauldia sp.]
MSAVEIRPLVPEDRAAWEPLWQGYLAFYETVLSPETTDTTWTRFHEPDEPMFALGAFVDGKLVGIVHYLFHRTGWAISDSCYLQDLFVSPQLRGHGVGRALIEAVAVKAREAGAARLYWHTHETNRTAQTLYDKVAAKTGFIQYRKDL